MALTPKSFFLVAYWHDPHWKQFAGATVKVLDLANNLTMLGNKVTLFIPAYNFNKKHIFSNIVEIPFLDLPVLRFLSFNFFLFLILLKSSIKQQPDIVYVRRMQSVVPLLIAKLLKIKFFFEVNDDPYRQLYHSGSHLLFKIKSKIATKMDEINLKVCNKAFIVTDEIKDRIMNKNPLLEYEKLITINSGANTKLLKPLNKPECCKKIGIDPNKNYIGFLGTIFEHSGLDVLIACSKQVLNKISDAEFLIFGDGPQKKSLVDKTKDIGINHKFKFFGQLDYLDLPIFLGATDVCVAPFLEMSDTNSATKIFDYLACGKPVVASNIKNKENIFAESKTVYCVKPGDPNMLADAIIYLLRNKKYANEMGERGRSFIVSNYSREEIARKVANFADSSSENFVN